MITCTAAAARATRISPVAALAEAPRRPRRHRALLALSTRLPAVGLIGLRLVARRPLRSVVAAAGIAVAACGLVVVLLASARLGVEHTGLAGGLRNPDTARLENVMLVLTISLTALSLIGVVFVASATATDSQASLAVIQALGASPAARLAALATASALPAAFGCLVGLPAGLGLFAALNHSPTGAPYPVLSLVFIAPATIALTAALAAVTAHLHTRRPLADILRSETA